MTKIKITKKLKKYSYFQDGVFTVEASLIFPIIILVVFSLFYLMFYLHDRCIIQAVLNNTAAKGDFLLKHESSLEPQEIFYERLNNVNFFSLNAKSQSGIEQELKKYLTNQLEHKLFISYVDNINLEITKTNLYFTLRQNIKISLIGTKKFLLENKQYNELSNYRIIHNPSEFIRGYEALLKKIQGVGNEIRS